MGKIMDFYIGDYVKVVRSNGLTYYGVIQNIMFAEELEQNQDYLSIISGDQIVDFYEDQIQQIELADMLAPAS